MRVKIKINLQIVSRKLKEIIDILQSRCEALFSVVSLLLIKMGYEIYGTVMLTIVLLNWLVKGNTKFYKSIHGEKYAEVVINTTKYRYFLLCLIIVCLTVVVVYALLVFRLWILEILREGHFAFRGETI